MIRTVLILIGFSILGAAIFIAWTPWRVHGGRFAAEYVLLSAVIALISAGILYFSSRLGQ